MARMKFLVDAERCIECNGCVTACKNENEVPWGVNRRRVVTINDGVGGGEKSISVAAMHCADAPGVALGRRGKMDKCPFCAGGPEADLSEAEFRKYGRNRLAEGKLPACAEMCSTKALLGGDGDVIADIYRHRVLVRGKGSEVWGWGNGYGKPEKQPTARPGAKS